MRVLLTADCTYYVRTDGNDANDGMSNNSAGAWLTLQHAADFIQQNIDIGNNVVTVQVGAGTYSAGVRAFNPFVGGKLSSPYGVKFKGDEVTPSNVVIAASGTSAAFSASFGAKFGLGGFKVQMTNGGDGLYTSALGQLFVDGPLDFGAVTGYHIHAGLSSTIVIVGNHYITGGASCWIYADRGGGVEALSGTVNVSNVTFRAAFAYADNGSLIYSNQLVFTGSTTGPRFNVNSNAVIDSVGGGVNYFPGTVAGYISTGGVYK